MGYMFLRTLFQTTNFLTVDWSYLREEEYLRDDVEEIIFDDSLSFSEIVDRVYEIIKDEIPSEYSKEQVINELHDIIENILSAEGAVTVRDDLGEEIILSLLK